MKIHVLKGGQKVEVVDNAFCATGAGGGVDPTCSPGKQSLAEKTKAAGDRLKEVQEKASKLLQRLGGVSPSVKVSKKSEFKESKDLFNGYFDTKTNTIHIAAGNLPATSTKLNVGQNTLAQSVADVAVHEYGHQVLEKMNQLGVGSPGRVVNIWRMTSKSQLLKKVSSYSASHPTEMFAEGFLAYTHPTYGKKGGPKLPKDLESYFKELFE